MALPDYQTASGCADFLMHTMERYFNHGDNMELTDGISEALMRTVLHFAHVLRDDPRNYDARAEIMWASSFRTSRLTGFGNGRRGLGHAQAGSMSWAACSTWRMEQGLRRSGRAGRARCVPSASGTVCQVCRQRHGRARRGDEEELARKGIAAWRRFFRSIGMPHFAYRAWHRAEPTRRSRKWRKNAAPRSRAGWARSGCWTSTT